MRLRNIQVLILFAAGASIAGLAWYFDLDARTIERATQDASKYPEMLGYRAELALRRMRAGVDRVEGESRESYLGRVFNRAGELRRA